MPRRRRNPFYAVLGAVGFAFAITATSYSLAVLRGVRQPLEAVAYGVHPLHALMDRHGGGILAAELLLLAAATVGAIWMDHVEGERIRAARRRTDAARRAGGGTGGAAADGGPAGPAP